MDGCRTNQSPSPAQSPGPATSAGTLWLTTMLLLKAEKGSGCCLPGPEQESAVEFGLECYGEVVQGRVSDGNSKMQGCQF